MILLHPEFITQNGKKEFAVIPYEEFKALQKLIADIEDLRFEGAAACASKYIAPGRSRTVVNMGL
jgi:PHD/YefM family antitoxin component YafN of YafNO toxin-antitoxin module